MSRSKDEIENAKIGINCSPMNVSGDEMFKRHHNAWGTEAFCIRRSALEDKQVQFGDKELFSYGIYFLVGNIDFTEKIYVGKADNIIKRLRQHVFSPTASERNYYYDVWERAIVITSTSDAWRETEVKALEAIMIKEIPDENTLNSKEESVGDNIAKYYEDVRSIELYLAACGVKTFDAVDGAEKIVSTYVPNEYSRVEDLQNGLARIPEIVTPDKVVKAMVDMLPADVWNSKTKFLDPACKGGEYLREIYDRLMKTEILKSEFPSVTARSIHILQHQIYGIALSPVSKERATQKLEGYGMNIRVIPNYIQVLKTKFIGDISEADKREYFINILNKEFGKEMNIDVVIGNPPYNESTGNGNQQRPLYNDFVIMGDRISNVCSIMIIPNKWLGGGIGLNQFRQYMMNCKHLKIYKQYIDSSDIFNGVKIAGGVGYYLMEKNKTDIIVDFICNRDGTETISKRQLSTYPIIVSDNQSFGIIEKIKNIDKSTMEKWVHAISLFNLPTTTFYYDLPDDKHNIKLYSSGKIGYIADYQIEKGREYIDKFCTMIGAAISGNLEKPYGQKVLTICTVKKPREVSTQAYIQIGGWDKEEPALICEKYLKTRFTRFLLFSALSSIHISSDKFCFVPDIINQTEIDWSQSIADIDKQLYKKYNLSDEEIAYIEKTIKPMN